MDATHDSFERQVIRATQKLALTGQYVKNPLLAACAEVMLKEFDPDRVIPNCSNSALRASVYVGPR